MTAQSSLVRFGDETIAADRRLRLLSRSDARPAAHLGRGPFPPDARHVWKLTADEAVSGEALTPQVTWFNGGLWVSLGSLFRAFVPADGKSVTYQASGLSAAMIDHLLVDSVLPLRLAALGRSVADGTALRCGNGAVVLLGSTGAGKSTLTHHLVTRGARFLADDCVLFNATGEPTVTPTYPSMRLRPSAAEHAGIRASRTSTGKHHVRVRDLGPTPVPLRAVVILERQPRRHGGPEVERIGPLDLLTALLEHRFSAGNAGASGRQAVDRMTDVAASASVTGYRLRYPTALDRLDVVAESIEQLARWDCES